MTSPIKVIQLDNEEDWEFVFVDNNGKKQMAVF